MARLAAESYGSAPLLNSSWAGSSSTKAVSMDLESSWAARSWDNAYMLGRSLDASSAVNNL